MSAGQKLWARAKRVIPGGSMLLSKRSEMFLPEKWPAYFSHAKGCRVRDLDGREYVDMCLMGIGTNILGYGREEVDSAVRQVIDTGNMSTLNGPEEVHLAERLVGMHSWAEMARFARSGGEANTIAIRIARAHSGRDGVAFCGYHGWHDWYLAANLGDNEQLAGHLLRGLAPRGVPRALAGSVTPFAYNDFDGLGRAVRQPGVGVIKMEVSRSMTPAPGFLERARELADELDCVLVFDECTSGFRQSFGGLHLLHGVEPDVAVFGKTLGNGYAVTAVIGRAAVMQAAQDSFISSTFWTERIGAAAALAALDVMEREESWDVVTAVGTEVVDRWQKLADLHGLPIATSGLPALATYSFELVDAIKYKTLISQEMLKSGFLASTALYACVEHSADVVDDYFEALTPVFTLIAECEAGRSIDDLLEGPPCHMGFSRLN